MLAGMLTEGFHKRGLPLTALSALTAGNAARIIRPVVWIFRDVINEFYVADTSRKMQAVFKPRMENGQRLQGFYLPCTASLLPSFINSHTYKVAPCLSIL